MLELLLVAIGLLVLATSRRRDAALERRVSELEERVARLSPRPSTVPPETERAEDAAARPIPQPAPAAASSVPPATGEPEQAAGPKPPPSPPRSGGFEEALGSRWAVWVGGVALGLGGIFLVRYSIEQGLVGPGVRIALGLALAVALVGAGEWLRRRAEPPAVARFGLANIPAVLTAAGTSTAFASVYAAYGLYGLVGPGLAFVALGAVSFVTMAAALLHGPALAALGLVAALACPFLLDTADPNPFALMLYLAFATGAAYGVARIRLWRWLAICAASGALLWGAAYLAGGDAWDAALLAHVLVQLALALLFLVVDPNRGTAPENAFVDRMATTILFCFALLAIVAGAGSLAGSARFLFVGAVALMMTGASIRIPAAAGGLLAAGLSVVGGLAAWPVASEAAREPERIVRDLATAPYPDAVATFILAALVLTATVSASAAARLAYGARLRTPVAAFYAAAGTLTPLGALVVAYARLSSFDHSIPFALLAAILAVAFAGVAGWFRRRDSGPGNPVSELAVGAFASASVAALSLGLTFVLDRGVLTIALALSALGTAVIAEQVRVRALRIAVAGLGLVVAARLGWDPSVMRGDVGRTPILNWLLWGYGVPAVAFLAAGRIMARSGRDNVVRFVESLGYLFAALLIFLEIRHALYGGDPFARRSDHLEAGLVATEALGFVLLMVRLDLVRPDSLYRYASIAIGFVTLAGTALGLGLAVNPYVSPEPVVGGPVFNSLLAAYLLPGAMAAAVAQAARANRPPAFVVAATVLALGLVLAYGLLEIRRFFHPDGLIGFDRPTSQGELWSYSLALLALGSALLAFGISKRLPPVRQAALACLAAAVLKVFLVDLSALEGLTRALSFVGLGVALLGIGFAYQRLVSKASAAGPEG